MIEYFNITENDSMQLAELDMECFSVPWSESTFFNEAKNEMAYYVIAKERNVVIGYAGFWKVIDEGQITNIAVRENLRGKGIAKKMIDILIKKALDNQITRLTLEVRESNVSAIGLYTSKGFKVVGNRKNYYKNPQENAILMDLELKGNENG